MVNRTRYHTTAANSAVMVNDAKQWRRWKPSLWDRIRTFLLSNGVQTAVQLTTGENSGAGRTKGPRSEYARRFRARLNSNEERWH